MVVATPAGLRARKPASGRFRDHTAMFNAVNVRSVVIDDAEFHPTIRLEYTSSTNDTYNQPCHIEQYVKSATHN